MKVTRQMINRAENAHYRSETLKSLQKQNALEAVYHKQHGNKRNYRMYAKLAPKSMINKIEGKKQKSRPIRRRSSYNPLGGIPRFKF